jgi:peroxiredoxin
MTQTTATDDLGEAFRLIRGMDASLNDQLQAFSDTTRKVRPGLSAAVDRLVTRLQENGAGEWAPQTGEPMPPFHLPDETGHLISLEKLLTKGPAAVTFHRGHWCPYCRISINALSRAHKEIAAEGGQIVAIMPERQQFASRLKSAAAAPFSILTDMDNGYAFSLNLVIWLGAELQRMLAGSRDIPTFQGNDFWLLPIPATFVVGTDGIVKARFVDPDYRRRMDIDDLLAAFRIK